MSWLSRGNEFREIRAALDRIERRQRNLADQLDRIELRQQATNKTIMDINERLTAVEKNLDEASTEITAELAKLREQLGNTITPEADATIGRLETKSKALADVIPAA